MHNQPTALAEAPWSLTGKGFMFLYNFPKDWANKANFMPVEQVGDFQGGLGTLMLVDYEHSNVGPYQELLLIPGKFSWQKFKSYAIARIWVSSNASVVNGRNNWGIPKNIAQFSIATPFPRHETWSVADAEGQTFFQAHLSFGRIPIPIHTALLPFPLLQLWQGKHFLTKFSGFGMGRLAKLESLAIHQHIFPDISAKRPLIGLRVDPFHIRFPVPKMIPAMG